MSEEFFEQKRKADLELSQLVRQFKAPTTSSARRPYATPQPYPLQASPPYKLAGGGLHANAKVAPRAGTAHPRLGIRALWNDG